MFMKNVKCIGDNCICIQETLCELGEDERRYGRPLKTSETLLKPLMDLTVLGNKENLTNING